MIYDWMIDEKNRLFETLVLPSSLSSSKIWEWKIVKQLNCMDKTKNNIKWYKICWYILKKVVRTPY